MKHKIWFTVQVFSTLIIFMSIFITSLRRNKGFDASMSGDREYISSPYEETGRSINSFNPFAYDLNTAIQDEQ